MRLLTCHIENYGKMSGADLSFGPGVTAICEPNGSGKTTLASFLKAVFYGMEPDRANSQFNDRRHYYPFGGGLYGGYVTFEAEGATYKIERYFDEKSDTRDKVAVYRNGVPLADVPENLGEKFFGIDKASFERTVFVTGAEIAIASTSGINTKLNNMLEGVSDDTDLASALERLENKSKEYRKLRTGNDLLSQETRRIALVKEQIENLRVIERGLPEKYERADALRREIDAIKEQIDHAQTENVVLNDWERYDAMTAEIGKRKEEAAAILAGFPKGLPTLAECEQIQAAAVKENALEESAKRRLFTEEDSRRFAQYSEEFGEGVPTEEELAAAEERIRREEELSFGIRSGSPVLSEKEEKLRRRFASGVPAEEAERAAALAEEIRKAEAEMSALPDEIAETPSGARPGKPLRKWTFAAVAAVAAVLLAAGIATVFFSRIAGIVLLALGGAGLLGVGFLYLNKKAEAAPAQIVMKENPAKREARRRLEILNAELSSKIAPYGYSMANGAAFAAASFREDCAEMHRLLAADAAREKEEEKKNAQRAELARQNEAFFARFRLSAAEPRTALSGLRTDIASFETLKKRKWGAEKEESELAADLRETRSAISAFFLKYGLSGENASEQIANITRADTALRAARKAAEEMGARAEAFKRERRLAERPQGEKADLSALNEQIQSLRREETALSSKIAEDERDAEALPELENVLAEAEERLGGYRETYRLLTATIASLKEADGRLKERYIKPIKDKFVFYSSALEKALGEKITLDANFDVRFLSDGQERSEKHLSAGQRSLVMLCFRLALIDNLYGAEKPFLIFDDPFANLDEAHMEKVRILLGELGKAFQIVYFSCHGSRAL